MNQRLKNIIFISICEACVIRHSKTKNKEFYKFNQWCNYYGQFIIPSLRKQYPSYSINETISSIYGYLYSIYGLKYDESLEIIEEFFNLRLWVELEDIAEYLISVSNI